MFLKRQEHQGVLIGTNGFFNGFIASEENLHNICYLSNVLKIAEAKLSRHLSRGFYKATPLAVVIYRIVWLLWGRFVGNT